MSPYQLPETTDDLGQSYVLGLMQSLFIHYLKTVIKLTDNINPEEGCLDGSVG